MQKVLRTEIKKAIMTRYFIISIAIGILISMLGLVYNVGLFIVLFMVLSNGVQSKRFYFI